MKDYTFIGISVITASLRDHGDIVLIPGDVIALPEENSYISSLEKQGLLVEVQKPKPKNGK